MIGIDFVVTRGYIIFKQRIIYDFYACTKDNFFRRTASNRSGSFSRNPQHSVPPPPRGFGSKRVKRILLAVAISALAIAETQAQMPITLDGTNGMRAMTITFGGDGNYRPSGNFLFARGSSDVANSSHSSLGQIISPNTFLETRASSPFPYNATIEGSFSAGQYVPFNSSLPMSRIANGATNNFNVVGLRFFILNSIQYLDFVTDSASAPPAGGGQIYTYTANSERFFSLDATVGATFDQAFNPGTFRMGGDSDGIRLRIVPEPEEYALVVGLGLLAFAFVRKWRGRVAAKPANSG